MADSPLIPSDEELRSLLAGKLARRREEEIAKRLEEDAELRERLDRLSGTGSFSENFYIEKPKNRGGEGATDTPGFDISDRKGSLGRLGKFEILAKIGAGGMASVYRAFDPELDREVAIKILKPELSDDEDVVRRFQQEAMSVASIEHDHILPVYEIGNSANLIYQVTRFVEGETLLQRLEAHPGGLPVEEVRVIAMPVASALAAAHSAGLVHRDVKPSNILIQPDGKVWLTDFGLVKALSSPLQNTREGVVMGTPHYMSPEQAKGGVVDIHSDLFSLGCVMHHMLTGEPPFDADHLSAIFWQITEGEAFASRKAKSSTPRWMTELVERLLEKNPGNRPKSAEAVLDLLEQRKAPVKKREKKVKVAVSTIVATGLLGVFAFWKGTAGQEPDDGPFVAENGDSFSILSEALEKAGPNTVIEIAHSGSLETGEAVFSNPITIRPAPGYKPVLEARMDEQATWVSESKLTLEGLTIRYSIEGFAGVPFLVAEGEELILKNCRFVTPRTMGDERLNQTPQTFIDISATSRTVVENCEVLGRQLNLLRVAPSEIASRSVELCSNVAACKSLVQMEAGKGKPPPVQITLENNLLKCNNNFVFGALEDDTLLPDVSIDAKQNLLEAEYGLCFATPNMLDQFSECLGWNGDANLFAFEHFVTSFRYQARGKGFPETVEEWRTFTGSPENGSLYRKVAILEVNSGAYDDQAPLLRNPEILEKAPVNIQLDLEKAGPSGWSLSK